jgi:hypothetical protein
MGPKNRKQKRYFMTGKFHILVNNVGPGISMRPWGQKTGMRFQILGSNIWLTNEFPVILFLLFLCVDLEVKRHKEDDIRNSLLDPAIKKWIKRKPDPMNWFLYYFISLCLAPVLCSLFYWAPDVEIKIKKLTAVIKKQIPRLQ